MTWETLLFVHWRLPPQALRAVVPAPLKIDTFDDWGWIGLVPFTMPTVRLRGLPPIPTTGRFHECNVRTYVTHDGRDGVYFLSLDAASRLAVWAARRWWGLNYHHARIDLRFRRDGDVVDYSVKRKRSDAELRCTWRIGAPRPRSSPGELDFFLTERYALFVVNRRGRTRQACIHHEPWSLRDAELLDLDDGLLTAAGVTIPDEEPVLFAADRLEVAAWPLA